MFGRLKELVRKYDDETNFTCDICGREVFGGERICADCYKRLPLNRGLVCPYCGRRVREEGACLECKEKPLKVKLARSACLHEGDAMALVLRFKKGRRYLYRTACDLVEPLLKEFPDADAFTFVPMTAKAEKKRGYNQSRLLAEELARRSGLPCLALAVKQRETEQQKTLGRREREENLEGCFHVTDRAAAKGKKLIVADDTMTTGATASELADALLRAGAACVYLVTVTSVEKKQPFGKPPRRRRKE